METKINQTSYLLCAFLLGGFGVHHFLTKNTTKGILYLVFCWTGIPTILGIIDGIKASQMHADENGNIVFIA